VFTNQAPGCLLLQPNAQTLLIHSTQECKEENFEFISRIFERSGISPTNTYLPAAIHPVHNKDRPHYDMDAAKVEAEMVMCGAVSDLLEKTGAQ